MPSVLNNKKDMHNKPAVTIPSLHYKKYNVGRRASVSRKCYPRPNCLSHKASFLSQTCFTNTVKPAYNGHPWEMAR